MTGNDIFNCALDLLGMRESDGTVSNSCADLSARALPILNLLLADNAIPDSRLKKRPLCITSISALTATPATDELINRTVLPYGLAAMLIADEDRDLSLRMYSLYKSAREAVLASSGGQLRPITEVYG